MVNDEPGDAVAVASAGCATGAAAGGLPPVDAHGGGSVLDRLDEVAALLPGYLAVTSADGDLTHAALHRRVRALAHELDTVLSGPAAPTSASAAGRGREPIGIFAAQGTAAVAAALAVVATGRPFVLLDVLLPDARVGQLVERAGVTVVLADDLRRARAAGLPGVRVVRGLLPAEVGVVGEVDVTERLSRPDVDAADSI